MTHLQDNRQNTTTPENVPSVTIIVAVLNGANTLQRCIDSFAEQTYPHKQLVVMDGGSKDGTVEILKANNHKVLYWESQPDRGIAHAWNKGLKHAKEDWIIFLGADDYLTRSTILAEMIPYLQAHRDDYLVYGRVLMRGGDWDGVLIGTPWEWKRFRRRMIVPHQAAFHSRKLFDEVGTFDESYRLVADYELLLRPKKGIFSPAFVDKAITIMSAEGLSMTHKEEVAAEGRNAQIKYRVAPTLLINLWYVYYRLWCTFPAIAQRFLFRFYSWVRVFKQKSSSRWRGR